MKKGIGIFKKIPLKNRVSRTDETTSNNYARVKNISVSENYTAYREDNYKIIKIGDKNNTITGSHSYTIKYTYSIGNDPLKDNDEFYLNLIGNEWDTSISNVTFKITMPKPFDESLLGFSSGYKGSTNNENVSYNVNENVISGSLNGDLKAGEGLTIRITLPEGYFIKKTDFYYAIAISISILCVLISYFIWRKNGKDDVIIDTVEFYPPEDLNSAEVGFYYKGKADAPSIISLLIYLADKGYIKIEEIEKQGKIGKSNGFKITKLKEYDGRNSIERRFLEGLFKCKKRTSLLKHFNAYEEDDTKDGSVTDDDLKYSFYRTVREIREKLDKKKKKIIESSAAENKKQKLILVILILLSILIFVLITVKPILEYSQITVSVNGIPTDSPEAAIPFALVFPGIGLAAVIVSVVSGKSNIPIIFAIFWGVMFGGIPWYFIVLPCLKQSGICLIMYILGIICICLISLFIKIMPKRTPYGTKVLGEIRGFKRFLEIAEKEQLEELVEQNPEYFYNILPYTYALGISDKWIKKFETINIENPVWYNTMNNFDIGKLDSFMDRTMTSASRAISSDSSGGGGSSGGGSSGGGSSGGGSGGGGGGSW